jgi:hypothetical protein
VYDIVPGVSVYAYDMSVYVYDIVPGVSVYVYDMGVYVYDIVLGINGYVYMFMCARNSLYIRLTGLGVCELKRYANSCVCMCVYACW